MLISLLFLLCYLILFLEIERQRGPQVVARVYLELRIGGFYIVVSG